MGLLLLFQNTTLQQICPQFGTPVVGEGYTPRGVIYTLNAASVEQILALPAQRDFWVGYAAGGFNWPSDVRPILTVTLWLPDGSERWLDVSHSTRQPDRYYVLPFANTMSNADMNGEHYGQHPCAAFWITAAEYDALLASFVAE